MMNHKKKFIVITSIFEPTEAVQKFAKVEGWQLVVVGDKKTPPNWAHDGVIYLDPEEQEKQGFAISQSLPWNHYCRKMAGYLYAIKQGAELIADSDDDNIPYENWPNLPDLAQSFKTLSGAKFVNIYNYFTKENVWPRGYPLNYLLEKTQPKEETATNKIGVCQFLANEDPDVDAIYRLTNNKMITFEDNEPIVLDKGTVSPFNSQNTIFSKEFFPLLFLPAFVTFRFTDILRGLVAQPILWQNDARLLFGKATVVQKRNPHNYLKDFESEIPVYLYSEKVIDVVSTAVAEVSGLSQQLIAAYEALLSENIVTNEEVQLLKMWVSDVEQVGKA